MKPLIWGVALPAGVAGIALLISHYFFKFKNTAHSLMVIHWTEGISFSVGFVGLLGFPSLLPIQAADWMMHIALLTPLFITSFLFLNRTWAIWIGHILTIIAASSLITLPLIRYEWNFLHSLFGILFITILGSTSVVASAALQKNSPTTSAILNFILLSSSSIVLAQTGSAKLGQLAGVLTATVAAIAVANRLFRQNIFCSTSSVIWSALLLCGHFFSELTWMDAALLWLAPVPALIGQLPGLMKWTAWKNSFIRLFFPLMMVSFALYRSFQSS